MDDQIKSVELSAKAVSEAPIVPPLSGQASGIGVSRANHSTTMSPGERTESPQKRIASQILEID